ncbi:putative cyclase-domain-containing protein [Aspergillus sergii]|uniref:Putative cyclase-domain-containing protein n=1 Tax=Aspergillus sergii TaxID=1034303 RepID=A0A5N6XER4_9EURO|nr:putative cyclase-domain-containing protein [Aspergillus sergii]
MGAHRPRFADLPLRKGDPPWSAWGLYGPDDQLGTLNLLKPEVILEAAKEIRTGRRIGLDLPVDYLGKPSHGRQGLTHKVIWKAPRSVHDDEISFNTQISTQWDGLRHIGYYREGLWYNGTKQPEISGSHNVRTVTLGIHAYTKEGVVGRGVLLDYHRWRLAHGRPFDTQTAHAITQEELVACAQDQKVEFKQGDILFVRSGWRQGYEQLTPDEKQQWAFKPQRWVGVETSAKTLAWLWETGFSACAGDAPGWECLADGKSPNADEQLKGYIAHEIMIAGWGMPLGEFFDLETLSEECHRQQRYSFFVSGVPLHVTGGVASPPNIVAIF